MKRATPWAQWMRIGLGVMGLSSDGFWSLSLKEWSMALEGFAASRGVASVEPLTKSELERLIEADRHSSGCHPRAEPVAGQAVTRGPVSTD